MSQGNSSASTVMSLSRVTVVSDSSSEEYLSTVEDNSQHTTRTLQYSCLTTTMTTNIDCSQLETDHTTSMREMMAPPESRKAPIQPINIVNNTPEQWPLLIRVNPVQRAQQTATSMGRHVSTPVQVVHLAQTKKHLVRPQLVASLQAAMECYELVPSFGALQAEQIFVLTPPIQNVKVLVLPSRQKIRIGKLPRETSSPELLLPPEGPREAKVLQPLWATVTFTIAYGKHVAVEYNIPQVPQRKIRLYRAEKHEIRPVDSATLYRDPPKETVIRFRAFQVHQLQLSTVERQDPQLVQHVRVEQNNGSWKMKEQGQIETRILQQETRTDTSCNVVEIPSWPKTSQHKK